MFKPGIPQVKRPIPERQNCFDQVGSLAVALTRWSSAGFATVDESVYTSRKSSCAACVDPESGASNFDPKGFGGIGKCMICGCMGFKLILLTEKCPMAKW